MKLINVTVFMVLCILNVLVAQDSIQKIKIYRTWITQYAEPFKVKGTLYQINDSTVSVSNSFLIKDYSINNFEVVNLHINNIEKIKVRKKNRIGKGILIGTISGAALGALLGYAGGDDSADHYFRFTAKEKAAQGAIGMGALGMQIGAIIGSEKIKIPIKGSRNTYKNNANALRGYSIKKK